MHSSSIYLKVKRVVIIRQSFRSTSPYQTCRRVLITKFGTTSWYRDRDFLGLGTPFSMYHRVHIKRVPIRLLCRLIESSTWYQTGTVGTRPYKHNKIVQLSWVYHASSIMWMQSSNTKHYTQYKSETMKNGLCINYNAQKSTCLENGSNNFQLFLECCRKNRNKRKWQSKSFFHLFRTNNGNSYLKRY